MSSRSLSFLVSLVAVGYLVIHPGVSPAVAAQLATQQVGQFVADPSALLKANPNGGGRLVSQIRDLMLSDTCLPSPAAPRLASCQDVLTAILGLLANANDAQKSAIGTGLGEAAQAMVSTNPTLASDIQTALAKNGDKFALEAYQTLTNTGGGGGGGLATGPTATGTASAGISGGSVTGASGTTSTVTQAVSAQ